jgi:hypothetical protein
VSARSRWTLAATANVPIGQTTQALVYVPHAVTSGSGTENLVPLGEAGKTASLHLEGVGFMTRRAQGRVAVNSLGLLDLVQIAAEGLAPQARYRVFLSDTNEAPFKNLQPLAVLKTNPDGAGVVQAIGPLKTLVTPDRATTDVHHRYLIVTESNDALHVVLRQASNSGKGS